MCGDFLNYLNYEFLEKFKQLDKLCRELYGESVDSKLGVTMYIDDMERNTYRGRNKIADWDSKLRRLKRVRNLRNEIAHSTSQSYECGQADIDFVCEFYHLILERKDPLALINYRQSQYGYSSQSKTYNSNSQTYQRQQYQPQPVGCATFLTLALIITVCFALIVF